MSKRHRKKITYPAPHLKPGDTPVWTPGGDPGSGAGIASVIALLDKSDDEDKSSLDESDYEAPRITAPHSVSDPSIMSAGANASRLRPWISLSFPDRAPHSYDRNIQQRKDFGEVSPWLNVEIKPSSHADLLILHGEIGKGTFTLVFRIKDGENLFTLTEEKQNLRAQAIVGEYKGAEGHTFDFPAVAAKAQYLSSITKAGYQRYLAQRAQRLPQQ